MILHGKKKSTTIDKFLFILKSKELLLVIGIIFGLFFVLGTQSFLSLKFLYLPQVGFSHKTGFYEEALELSLIPRKKTDSIVYTMDGSVPKENSKIYTYPIKISETTVVKAQTMRKGKIIGNLISNTYFIDHSSTLPIISLIVEPEYLWNDPGIYSKNFLERGIDWEIPAHLDLYDINGIKVVDMDLAMRMHGGTSRNHPQKSFRLCAKRLYGPRYIGYEVFENGPAYHRCLLIRNSGNDWAQTMMRDGTIQRFADEIGLDAMKYQPGVLYINGEYYGIQNIREFYHERYFVLKYGAREDLITVIRPRNRNDGYPTIDIGKDGDELDYLEIREFLGEADMTKDENLARAAGEIDLENLTKYMIFQIFVGNHDWPQSNTKLWKFTDGNPEENAKYGLDGKYRYLVYDIDHGFGYGSPFEANSLYRAITPSEIPKHPWATIVLGGLLKNEKFRIDFINKYADLLNTTFTTDHLLAGIEKSYETIKPEIPNHIKRWEGKKDRNDRLVFASVAEWTEKVDVMREYVKNRPDYAKQHVVETFGLSGYSKVSLDVVGKGRVKINTLEFVANGGGASGDSADFPRVLNYFNDVPIKLEAKPGRGYDFVGWVVSDEDFFEPNIEVVFTKDTQVTALFEKNFMGKIFRL